MVKHMGTSKENKLADRNVEGPCVHLKPSNEPTITTKIITQMQEACVLTSQQQLHEIITPTSSCLEVLKHHANRTQVSGEAV